MGNAVSTKASDRNEVSKYKDLDKLSVETLRSILDDEFTAGSFFKCEEAAQLEGQEESLSLEIAGIFQRYRAIRWPFGEINRSDWHPYEFDSEYLVIGTGLEHSFLIRAKQETIYILPEHSILSEGMETFQTIAHFLLNEVIE